MEQQRADWVFPAEVGSVPAARSQITERLADLSEESLEVVRLLTTELMTNAVRHGAGPVLVQVTWGDGEVRVEVEDRSPQRPVVRATDHDASNGRGLRLVDGLATGWGVLPARNGKRVWFTVDA
jgi:anti-sigma regulatory factor (Ser/Thr protein kinase)